MRREWCRMRCGAAGWIVAAFACAAPADAPPPRDWSPAVSAARAAYEDGRYDDAAGLLTRVLTDPPDAAARRDAELLQALCLLRQPERTERLSGRGLLAQLARADPRLHDDPDCLLAYGVAQTALAETGSALDALARAADGFAAQHRPDAQLAALAALAQAWAAHGEWFATPARFRVDPPRDPAEADAIRGRQIERVRAEAAALPGSDAIVAAIDLTLARHRLKQPETADGSRTLLEALAQRSTPAETAAEAALVLARLADDAGRAADAHRWYGRAADVGSGRTRQEALERIAALSRPELTVAALEPVGSEAAAPLDVTARGLVAVQLEVRRIDLDAWLARPTQRGNEALLPESGSVALAREFQPGQSLATAWRSAALTPPLAFRGPPGAYAVIARGRTAEGREVTAKRLLIVSDLLGIACVGLEEGAVFGLPRPAAAAPPDLAALTGRFWMYSSFAPTEIPMTAGAGLFALPPEARVARERRWVCLLRAGAHVALCRGELPDPAAAETRDAIFFAAPAEVAPGGSVAVAGWIAPPPDPATATPPAPQAELVDTLERVLATAPLTPDVGGGFAVQVRVPPDTVPQALRVLLRASGRSIENLAPPQTIRVLAPTGAARLECDLPTLSTADQPAPRAAPVSAVWAWGAPATLRGGRLRISIHTPTPVPGDVWSLPFASAAQAFAAHDRGWTADLSALDPTGQARLLECGLELTGWLADGRSARRLASCAVQNRSAGAPPAAAEDPLPRSAVELSAQLRTDERPPFVDLEARTRDGRPVAVLLEGGRFVQALVGPPNTLEHLRVPLPAGVSAANLRLHAFVAESDRVTRVIPRAVRPPPSPGPSPTVAIERDALWGDARLRITWDPACPPSAHEALLIRVAELPTERWRPPWAGRVPDAPAVAASLPLSTQLAVNDVDWPELLPTQRWRALAGPTAWCAAVPLPKGTGELSVPLPEARCTQTVSLWLVNRHGFVGDANIRVPAAPTGAAWLDVPPRWTVGDRGRVTLGLTRPAGAALTARVSVEGGELLALEQLRYRTGLTGDWQLCAADGVVPLAAGATTWITVEAEAARPGSGSVRLTLEPVEGDAHTWSAPLEIAAAPGGTAATDALELRRTIEVWVPEDSANPAPPLTIPTDEPRPGPSGTPAGSSSPPAATRAAAGAWVPVPPGRPVPPERYLRVREEFELRRSDGLIVWTQPLPLTCTSLAADPPECPPLGRRVLGPAERLQYRLPLLPPGTHRHAYVLLTTRTGSGLLPPPELRLNDVALPVRVAPGETRLTVQP